MSKRLAWLASSLAAASLAAAGLAAPKGDPVAAAALKTERAGSAKIAFRASVSMFGQSFGFSGSGVVSGKAARVSFRFPSALMPGSDPTGEMIFHVERGRPIVYARFGFLQDQLPPGKRWIRIDLAKEAKKQGVDLTKLMGGAWLDDWSQSSLLRYGRSTRVRVEKVRGERMTRYRSRVDLEEVASRDKQLAGSVRELMRQTGMRKLTLDAWVDSRGYLRQLRQSFPYRDASTALSMRTATTLTYLRFGARVAIKAPPAREVVDASALGG